MQARGLYVNTHVGQSLREGGLAWAVEKYDPDFIVLVEVVRFLTRRRVRKMFPKDQYSITGLEPADRTLLVKSGTLIIARRSVLKRKSWRNPLLTKQRWVGPVRDKWHPIRRLTRGVFVFAENPDVELEIGADHAWTHAGYDLWGPASVPTEHRFQIRRFAQAAGEANRRGVAVLDIGDMNERAELGHPAYVQRKMRAQGMRTLVRQGLDYVFGNDKVSLENVEIIPEEKVTTDHPGFVIDVKVRN